MVGSNGHPWIRPSILTNICMLVRDKYVGQDRRGLTELWRVVGTESVPRPDPPAALCPTVLITSAVLCGGLPWADAVCVTVGDAVVAGAAEVIAVGEHDGGLVVLVVL